MRRPVIGICTAVEQARWGVWDSLVLLSPRNYSLAVQREGALALLLSPDDVVAGNPEQLVDMLDGLLLAGGSDVDPATYGAEPHPETAAGRPERDRFELALARAAIERDLPLLGVCRGMQMLNVAMGGTLDQHVADVETHRHTPGAFCDHEVALAAGSLAARAAGSQRLAVRSHHHQGVERLGDRLAVTGRAVGDDLIEALELPDRSYVLGVLWHPEEQDGEGVVPSFVRAAHIRGNA